MIYFLKFSQPIGNPASKHGLARYYVGWTQNEDTLQRRLEHHRAGQGAAICAAAARQGRRLEVVLTMPGDRSLERKIKRQHNHRLVLERLLKAQGATI